MTKARPHAGALDRDAWDKWFWSDYRADEGLALCSWAARGFWMECLGVMSKAMPKGHLLIGGEKPDLKQLLVLTRGTSVAELRRCLEELTRHKVCSYTDDGVMFSRRMVRDAARRERARLNGEKGGSPILLNLNGREALTHSDNQSDNQRDNPSVKVAANPQKPEARSQKPEPDLSPARFARFWEIWPRRVARARAVRAWQQLQPDEPLTLRILAAVARQAGSVEWQREDGRYIPHPASWLNGRRWEDEPVLTGPTPTTAAATFAQRVDEGIERLCSAAGLNRYSTYEWFAGARLITDRATGRVRIEIPENDHLDFIQKHYADALESVVIAKGGSGLVITGGRT